MCGCMLMHATMNHAGHQPALQSTSVPVAAVPASDYKCAQCAFPLQQGYAFCPSCGMGLNSPKCAACGQKIDPSWKACAYCGSPLD
ncbi:MAG: zinc ribbon domain-containing protein [Anaerolineales bacterium]